MFKTINKNNWTGEQAKICISVGNHAVSLYGVCGEPKWEKFSITINTDNNHTYFCVTHQDWTCPLIVGYYDGTQWYAQADVQIMNKCLYIAVAQVLYNIL